MDDQNAATSGELRYAVAPVTNVEVRDPEATGDNTWTMTGYAAVFGEPTTIYDSKFYRLTEEIDPGAFDHVLENQGLDSPAGVVHFNHGHDMQSAVAATNVASGAPGSLELRAEDRGLHFFARVPRDDPDGVRMASKMRTGVLGQASFAFTVAEDQFTYTETADGPDTEHRRILRIGHLYDVCACSQGAYSTTTAVLRSYAAARGLSLEQLELGPNRLLIATTAPATGASTGTVSIEGGIAVGSAPAEGGDTMDASARLRALDTIRNERRQLGTVR